ncbi:MAG TPA: GAF domain-containing protein [Methylomirabilota bacterium]|nr:GAF domain-containing protein [Methylomirabilota bacterium]
MARRTGAGAPELRTLGRLGRLVTSSLGTDAVLEAFGREAGQLVGAADVGFWLADEAARTLTLREVGPRAARVTYPVKSMAYGESVVGWVAEHREAAWVADARRDRRVVRLEWWKSNGFKSLIALPIVHGPVLIAVLVLVGKKPFATRHREMLELFAAQAAVAIVNARLYADSNARREAAEALGEVGRLLSQTLDPTIVARRITEHVCRLLDARSAAVYRPERDTGVLVADTVFETDRPFEWEPRLLPGTGVAGLALETRAAYATPDVVADRRLVYTPETRAHLEARTHRAMLCVPLLVTGRPLGALVVGDQTGRRFSREEIERAEAFADQAALALENARLYAEADARRREAEVLAEVARTVGATLEPDVVLARIAEAARELCTADLARIALWDAATDSMIFRYGVGARFADYGRIRIERGVGHGGLAWASGHAVRTDDRRNDPRFGGAYTELVAVEGSIAALCVPIRSGERVEGLIFVDNRSPRPFTDRDERVLSGLADHAAVALRNARLFQALRDSEEFLARAQAVAQIGSWISSPGGKGALSWSREVFRIFGVQEEEFGGTVEEFFARVHPDDVEMVRRASEEAVAERRPYAVDHRIVRPDGTVRWVHERADVLRDEQDRPTRIIGIVQDITDRRAAEDALRRSEAQLRQSQKMEAVGRLAGGVAHDFNNLLTVITGRTQLMLARIGDDIARRRELELIEQTAERAGSLTKQLLAFSRKQVLQPTVLDLNTVMSALAGLLRRLIGEDIELTVRPASDLPPVHADRAQLEQVLVNLAVNARDAMPRGGRLVIATGTHGVDGAGSGPVPPGDWVTLSVADTGHGIDPASQALVFEPFFTTKEPGKGTGLGLSIVYGIVEQSGGRITLESEPGEGTTFTVYLPLAPERVAGAAARIPTAPPRGHETVLLVEDEPEVRRLTREILEMHGYAVLEAGDGAAALKIAREHPGTIDLLLTDVVMPGLRGQEVAQALAATGRRPRVLYISGYPDLGGSETAIGDYPLLPKPFSPGELARKVRAVLDEPRKT